MDIIKTCNLYDNNSMMKQGEQGGILEQKFCVLLNYC